MDYERKLKLEGFAHVYTWTDEPGVTYPAHAHKGKVSFFVSVGSITMKLDNNEVLVQTGERMDVPVGEIHTAVVGPDGCTFVVGEEIEGDS
ncbi:MAG TPA: hypothetical protein VJI73_01620 [Candidatus Paceibacterota bacterium]